MTLCVLLCWHKGGRRYGKWSFEKWQPKTLSLLQQWSLTSAQPALEITVWIHLSNSHEAQPNASLTLLGWDPTSPWYFTLLSFPDTAVHSLSWCWCLPGWAMTRFKFLTSSHLLQQEETNGFLQVTELRFPRKVPDKHQNWYNGEYKK